MYNLPYFKEEDQEVVLKFMREHPFVFLTGVNEENEPVATQVPVFLMKKMENYISPVTL
jgi:transcriptional regulator